MKSNRFLAMIIVLTMLMSLFAVPTTAYAVHKSPTSLLVERNDVIDLQAEYDGDENVKFIIEVEGDPLVTRAESSALFSVQDTKTILAQQSKVMSKINKNISENLTKGFVYTSVFNGFSIEGSADMMDELKAIDGVKNVYISREYSLIEPEPDTQSSVMAINASELTNITEAYDSGYKGEGMVVAVIDAGCDTSHEFFKEAPQNPRYSAQDIDNMVKTLPFNSSAVSSNQVYKSAKIPYAYNYVTNSADTYMHIQEHGTHVSGIATGKNGTAPDGTKFSGVAPEAQLVFFNCASEEGRFADEHILAALNDAVLMDVDLINLSLGADYVDPLCENIYSDVIDRCNDAGVMVVAANGNASRGFSNQTPYASRPDYNASGIPGASSNLTAVASVDNTFSVREGNTLEAPDGTLYTVCDGSAANPIKSVFSKLADGEYIEYVYCEYGRKEDLSGLELDGKIALVQRGEVTFAEKAQNVLDAGAVGMIIKNTSEEYLLMESLSIPTAVATLSEGNRLIELADKKLKYNGSAYIKEPIAKAGKLSYFTSWGVSANLELKPEISAPGGNIYASIPDNKYDALSGTSMATPHMTGVAALALQYYKTNPFIDEYNAKTGAELVSLVENLAMNSANVVRQDNGVIYSPRLQGAGLVDMGGILSSRVLLSGDTQKAKLSLRDDIYDTLNIEFDITNISKADVTFDEISIELVTDGYNETGGIYYVDDPVNLQPLSVDMPESITLSSGQKKTFSAEIKLDTEFIQNNMQIFTNGFFIDGFVFLKNKTDPTLKASLPFTGFCGDWGQATCFDSTIYDEGGSFLGAPFEEKGQGTFLFAYLDNLSWIMGRNIINEDIVGEEYISFSNENYCGLGFMLTLMRAAHIDALSIEDEDGNEVFRREYDYSMSKFKSAYFQIGPENLALLEDNRTYNLVVSGTLLADDSKTEEKSIPFLVDNTSPEIASAVYDENLETITVKMRDNHFPAYVAIGYTEDSTPQYDFKYIAEEEIDAQGYVTKTFDVSGISDVGDIEIECSDYALNATSYKMEYFMGDFGAEILSLEQLRTMTQLDMNVKNNTTEQADAKFIAAFYDDNNKLISTSIDQVAADAGKEYQLSFPIFANTQEASYIKLFIWSREGITPIDTQKLFPLG